MFSCLATRKIFCKLLLKERIHFYESLVCLFVCLFVFNCDYQNKKLVFSFWNVMKLNRNYVLLDIWHERSQGVPVDTSTLYTNSNCHSSALCSDQFSDGENYFPKLSLESWSMMLSTLSDYFHWKQFLALKLNMANYWLFITKLNMAIKYPNFPSSPAGVTDASLISISTSAELEISKIPGYHFLWK